MWGATQALSPHTTPSCTQVESRFRFLAADSTATMRGKRPSYREALMLIRDRLVAHTPSFCLLRQASALVENGGDQASATQRAKPPLPPA